MRHTGPRYPCLMPEDEAAPALSPRPMAAERAVRLRRLVDQIVAMWPDGSASMQRKLTIVRPQYESGRLSLLDMARLDEGAPGWQAWRPPAPRPKSERVHREHLRHRAHTVLHPQHGLRLDAMEAAWPLVTDEDWQWLVVQRQAGADVSPVLQEHLDVRLPGWRGEARGGVTVSPRMRREIEEAGDAWPAIFGWAQTLLTRARRQDARGELPDDQVALLNEHLPGWRLDGLDAVTVTPFMRRVFERQADAWRRDPAAVDLRAMRERHEEGALPHDQRALLDRCFPGWLNEGPAVRASR